MLGLELQITPSILPRTEQHIGFSIATYIHPHSLPQHSCSRTVPQLYSGWTRSNRHVVRVAQSTLSCGQQQQQQLPDSPFLIMGQDCRASTLNQG